MDKPSPQKSCEFLREVLERYPHIAGL